MTRTNPIRWLEETVAVCRVPHTRVLSVTGDDALSWLNSVTTQDLSAPLFERARLALFTDARGRIRADAVVLQREARIDVLVPAEAADELLAALESRVIMEDVELSRPQVVALTAQGPRAAELSMAARGYIHDRLGSGGFDLLVERRDADAIEAALLEEAQEHGGGGIDAGSWERARILQGRPRFGADFGPDTYPQEAGLEATHVSFEKGCYIGQEAIHMLQVRGKPPRRLVCLELAASVLPGASVMDSRGARVGQITSSTSYDGERMRALAMLRRAAAEADASDELKVKGHDTESIAATRLGLASAI